MRKGKEEEEARDLSASHMASRGVRRRERCKNKDGIKSRGNM